MPTYEYECKHCGHNFEVFQSMSDEPLKKCVKCGKEVRRLILGGAGVIFKGSGFYVTDKGRSGAASKSTSADAAGASKETVKPDTSPDTAASAAASTAKEAPDSKRDINSGKAAGDAEQKKSKTSEKTA